MSKELTDKQKATILIKQLGRYLESIDEHCDVLDDGWNIKQLNGLNGSKEVYKLRKSTQMNGMSACVTVDIEIIPSFKIKLDDGTEIDPNVRSENDVCIKSEINGDLSMRKVRNKLLEELRKYENILLNIYPESNENKKELTKEYVDSLREPIREWESNESYCSRSHRYGYALRYYNNQKES